MADSDWDNVTYLRKKNKTISELSSTKARWTFSSLLCHLGFDVDNHVSPTVAQAIMTARTSKQMSQKDFAKAICEKPSVVAEYEAGRAIPNDAILGKMERFLGVKLRGKGIGQPITFKKKT